MSTKARKTIRLVGGFDNAECRFCSSETPCGCPPAVGGVRPCRCECGRCQYPFPLPDDGDCYLRDHHPEIFEGE